MKDFSLSVIVPVYKEDYSIEDRIKKIHSYLKDNFSDFEIIIVNDNSRDNTYNILLKLSSEISHLKVLENDTNRGKGYSIKKGVLSANSSYILFSDADLSTPISEFDRFIDYFKQDIDIVIGSRALKGSQILKSQSFLRRNMGKIFNLLVQLFFLRGIKDTQCGFKCFRKEVAWELFKRQTIGGFAFDVEILYIAKLFGYSVKEIPVKWINVDKTRVSLIKDSFKMLFDLFLIKKTHLFIQAREAKM